MWKSEAEYTLKVAEGIASKKLGNLTRVLRDSLDDCRLFFINSEESERLRAEKEGKSEEKQGQYARPLYLVDFFEKFAEVNGLDFEFAIIREKSFISNRRKMEENPIYVMLDKTEKTTFMDVMYGKEKSVNTGNDKIQDTQIFYVYTSRENFQLAKERGEKVENLLIKYINNLWELV